MAQIDTVRSNPPSVLGETVSPGSVEISPVHGASPAELSTLHPGTARELSSLEARQPAQTSPLDSLPPVVRVPGSDSGNYSWWYGEGPPTSEIPADYGDMYYDTLTGNVYAFD